MLGERSTAEIHRVRDSQGVADLKVDAQDGGTIAGDARKNLEKKIGRLVVTKKNYLKSAQSAKRLKK